MSPHSLGTRGNVPEATSVVLFVLVAALLCFAMLHDGRDTLAAERLQHDPSVAAPPAALEASVATPPISPARE